MAKVVPKASRPGFDPLAMRAATGYLPIESYGLIGNLRTCALVGVDGGLDFMCWPEFDSPSVFCRLLDHDKGGHFSICPPKGVNAMTKQQYLPSSNLLQTRWIHEDAVFNVIDFFPRPDVNSLPVRLQQSRLGLFGASDGLKKWLIRRTECLRGGGVVHVEIFPAFNYARDTHDTKVVSHADGRQSVIFTSKDRELRIDMAVSGSGTDDEPLPAVTFHEELREGHLGSGVVTKIHLEEGQRVSLVLRDGAEPSSRDDVTPSLLEEVQTDTMSYWNQWISRCKYNGRYLEVVSRSLMILKLLTYEPTGAIIASPTFSLPEDFGGSRNWDYRYSWVRDSSFTIYILLRMGFTSEAEAYMNFISDRFRNSRTEEGALPIMFPIRGDTALDEIDLTHLDGYRGSKPVRIGNGAAYHTQLDIYGELLDAIYLYNKYGKPVSYDQWVAVREIIDYVGGIWREKDMSIWEVRNAKQNFVYSKIMLWVAFDRALRLSDKRCFPCPHRLEWLATRDEIYEDIMEKGYNQEMHCFVQSYESRETLDSSVLIAPLVFFIAPNDPRFLSTIEQILKPPEKGGLTSTGLVYRYNSLKSDDGVGGREGSFSMCTFWLVEALTRAGAYNPRYLSQATSLFENMLSFSNHLSIFSEEIARSGEQLGNTPQAFSHLALISAAFNLDRTGLSAGRAAVP
ncbi:MAG: hypothetical protein M1838_001370 [Thelocarpon superellum]|nr:MAG: hypothetical protein M1838_001370 [Thelocarpon superellum]